MDIFRKKKKKSILEQEMYVAENTRIHKSFSDELEEITKNN